MTVNSSAVSRETQAPATVRDLMETYEGLELDGRGHLSGGAEWFFCQAHHDPDVTPPATLPSIAHEDSIYFLLPTSLTMPDGWLSERNTSPLLTQDVVNKGTALIPEGAEDWITGFKTSDDEIIGAISKHKFAVFEARMSRKAKAVLEREREPGAGLYASAKPIAEVTPMLIEGLMRERGVSVIFGDLDEFKTTLVLDMMAHVATGSPWQGRKVNPRAVIWYALEGADEIPVRLRALETSLKGKDTPWGADRAPVTVLDRIPEDYREWRAEILRTANRWEEVRSARETEGEMPTETQSDGQGGTYECPRYPDLSDVEYGAKPVIVIDTLSIALGGEDEKGPRAVSFIGKCLDLLKERPEMAQPDFDYFDGNGRWVTNRDAEAEWAKMHPGEPYGMHHPAASHVIVIHHQTKTGIDFAGHRAIAADTQGLYRVHRFGNMTDVKRPFAGQLTPIRVKGIPRPAPIRFAVEIVPVEGTAQSAAILKDEATAIPKWLKPIMEAIHEVDDSEAITPAILNKCLDVVAAKGEKKGSAVRMARQRYREALEAAGVIEPIEDDSGKVTLYRFHDTGAV
jgi:hypothetical protein